LFDLYDSAKRVGGRFETYTSNFFEVRIGRSCSESLNGGTKVNT
jgi:hypothetical protein